MDEKLDEINYDNSVKEEYIWRRKSSKRSKWKRGKIPDRLVPDGSDNDTFTFSILRTFLLVGFGKWDGMKLGSIPNTCI